MRARMEAGTERHEASSRVFPRLPVSPLPPPPITASRALILFRSSPFHPQMEPKKTSPQPQPHMETKKSPPRAAVDTAAAGAESPLSSLFYPSSHGANGKEQDLHAILFKGQNGNAQAGVTDGKSQGTPAKSRTAYTKDNKHSHPDDLVDTSCFGSSVHYGGRDYFYGSSTPKQATESNDYKVDNKDPAADSHGDWWQGSFYY